MVRRRADSRRAEPIAAARRAAEALKTEVLRGDRLARRRYIREFHEEYSDWTSVVSREELLMDCWKAGIVYVGDYHALPASQDFAARLLADLAERSRRMILAVEVVRSRHQTELDAWLHGTISEEEFRSRIRYEKDWGYPWAGFRDLIGTAQEHGLPVAALDCSPRRGLRLIRKRDRTIAARITSLLQENPERRVFVHIGESHLASTHLPSMVRKSLHSVGMQVRDVVVVQNADEIYWDLLGSDVDDFEIVRVDSRRYCAFTATPLEKYEAYRHVLDAWESDDGDSEPDFQPVFYGIVDSILGFLGIDKFTWCVSEEGVVLEFLVDMYPEVYGPHRLPEAHRILEDLPLTRVEQIREAIGRRGCRFVPENNSIFMSRFDISGAAEEAAHFIHAALSGRLQKQPVHLRPSKRAFFQDLLWEARAWFGSKIVHPGRSFARESRLYPLPRPGQEPAHLLSLKALSDALFLTELETFLRTSRDGDAIPPELSRRFPRSRASIRSRAREMGWWLGQQMWDAYRNRKLKRRQVRDLFSDPLSQPDVAFLRARDLVRRTS